MNKKGQIGTGIILALITILVAIIINQTMIDDQTTLLTDLNVLNYTSAPLNQSFTLTPVGQRVRVATIAFTTISGNTTNLVSSTEAGIVVINNNNNGTTNSTYTFEPQGFITSGLARTVVTFMPVFIAIGGLAIAGFVATRGGG